MSASHPLASDDWGIPEWSLYRQQQQAACDRFGGVWAERVGRPLVALADSNIARLEAA